jgi:hypothetical protein
VEEITITVSCCEETGMLVAHWDDLAGRGGLTTQAERLSDLEGNIREAVEVHFEPSELPARIRLHFENDPILAAA